MLQTLPLLLVCPRTFSKLDVCPPANWQERFTQSLSHIRIHITHFAAVISVAQLRLFWERGGEGWGEREERQEVLVRLSGEVRLARFRWFPHVLFVHMGQGRREGTNRWVTRSTNRHKFSLSTTVSSVNIVRPMLFMSTSPL